MQRGVIFDFNGTMIFDGPCQEKAWRTWAHEHLGIELSDEDFAYHLHGVSIGECLEFMLGHWPSPKETDIIEAEREQCYRDLCLAQGDVYCLAPGLEAFLDTLASRGVALNIATASPLQNMEFHFEQLGLNRWFSLDTIVYNDRTFPSKPEPDIFLLAAQRMGIDMGACTVFEDSPSGLEAARRAKAGCIIAMASEYGREFLAARPGVERVIGDYLDAGSLYGLVGA